MEYPTGYSSPPYQQVTAAVSAIQSILAHTSQPSSPATSGAAPATPSAAALSKQAMPLESRHDVTSSGADSAIDNTIHSPAIESLHKRRSINSSKRAAQNRAAQRAFRQRRERYVANLEEKARQYDKLEAAFLDLQKSNYELLARLREAHAENAVLHRYLAASSSISPSPSSAMSIAFSPTFPATPIAGAVVALEPPNPPLRDAEHDNHLQHSSQPHYDHKHPYTHPSSSTSSSIHATLSPQSPTHHRHFKTGSILSSRTIQQSHNIQPHQQYQSAPHHNAPIRKGAPIQRDQPMPLQTLHLKQSPTSTKLPPQQQQHRHHHHHTLQQHLQPSHLLSASPHRHLTDTNSTAQFRCSPRQHGANATNPCTANQRALPSLRELTMSIGSMLPASPHQERQAASSGSRFRTEAHVSSPTDTSTSTSTPTPTATAADSNTVSRSHMEDIDNSRRRPW